VKPILGQTGEFAKEWRGQITDLGRGMSRSQTRGGVGGGTTIKNV